MNDRLTLNHLKRGLFPFALRLFMMQQGGVSKATKTVNLSEDIFAGEWRVARCIDVDIDGACHDIDSSARNGFHT